MLLEAVSGVARAIPLGAGYRIADVLSHGHRWLAPARSGAVGGNLRVVRGAQTDISALTGEVFRNYGRFLFELLRGPDVEELAHRFDGLENLERVLARGRGVILTVIHTGNWGITGARLAARGLPIHAVAGVQLNAAWSKKIRKRQSEAGIRILPPSHGSWREIPRILARNEAVALLVDGNIYEGGIPVTMFGRGACLPAGPAKLAGRTGAGLLPMYCSRRSDGTLSARFLEEIPVPDATGETLRGTTEQLARRYEEVLRELPGQWLIFRQFFDAEREGNE